MKFAFYVVAVAIVCSNGFGQTLEFEAASIKPAPPAGFFHGADSGTGGPGTSDPTTFRCGSCTLSSLILKAFALEPYQFPGRQSLPGDSFVVTARVPEGATAEQFQAMLQNLLKERFGLTYHFDKKEMQGYHLVLGKSGSKLVEAKEPVVAAPQASGQHSHDGPGLTFFFGGAKYRGDHQTTAELARMLAGQLAKPVDDQTGLTGKYDIKLNWAGDAAHSDHAPGAGGFDTAGHDHGGGGPSAKPDNASGPTLFEALQTQLGLKLVAGSKSTARILVVDHVEKSPTAN